MLILFVFFVVLFREPFRMMVMHPFRTIADPPSALVPGVMFVVIAIYHSRCWGRVAIGRFHMARFFVKTALERQRPKH
jgi:hypothetical protein